MTVLQKAILTIEADVDGDGSTETGEFHMRGNVEIVGGIRSGYLVGGRGSQAVGLLEGEASEVFLGFGGPRFWEISFRGWEGSDLQWGNTGNGGTTADATGEDPLSQMDLLLEYLANSDLDSRSPATLEYGEFWSGGRFDAQDVVPEQPQMTRAAEDGSWMDGNMTLLSAKPTSEIIDAIAQLIF